MNPPASLCWLPPRWGWGVLPLGDVVPYLCRSFISAGDQEEPYRVSCHCLKVPGLRLSSPGEEAGWSSGEL